MNNKVEFKIGDLVKVYKRGERGFLHKGVIISKQMGMFLVDVEDMNEPYGFYNYEMQLDTEAIREIKLTELLD